MTQEEKELLLKDLCVRLPYHPHIWITNHLTNIELTPDSEVYQYIMCETSCKPYLRPMSSMTEAEREEYYDTMDEYTHRLYPNSCDWSEHTEYSWTIATFDWLNKKMFDYRGLIEKGLALKAIKNMYNTI